MRLSTRFFILWHTRPGHSPGFSFERLPGGMTGMMCLGCGRWQLVLPGETA